LRITWREGDGAKITVGGSLKGSLERSLKKVVKTTEINEEKTTQKTTQKILALLRQNPHMTREELAKAVGISEAGIKFNLNKMKKQNLLKRVGPDKGGHWEVVK